MFSLASTCKEELSTDSGKYFIKEYIFVNYIIYIYDSVMIVGNQCNSNEAKSQVPAGP